MSQISYQSQNHVPSLLSSKWYLNNAVVNGNGTITISPGGIISIFIDTVTDKAFNYIKTTLDVTNTSINNESNFNNKLAMYVKQYYYNDKHSIYKQVDTVLGVNTYDALDVSLGRYRDINEIPCKSDIVAGIHLVIFNGTATEAIINNIGLYISQDINKTQAGEIYNSSISNTAASKLVMKLDRAENVVGFKVYSGSGTRNFSFRFLNNKLSTVMTDFGYQLLVDYEYTADTPIK